MFMMLHPESSSKVEIVCPEYVAGGTTVAGLAPAQCTAAGKYVGGLAGKKKSGYKEAISKPNIDHPVQNAA